MNRVSIADDIEIRTAVKKIISYANGVGYDSGIVNGGAKDL